MKKLTAEQQARVRKLVRALRTTQRKQGEGNLAKQSDDDARRKEFCCLGIACEVAIAAGLELKRKTVTNIHGKLFQYGDGDGINRGSTTLLPGVVKDWYGFSYIDPELFDENGLLCDATTLNDDKKYDFKRIAAAFERTYLTNTDDTTTS